MSVRPEVAEIVSRWMRKGDNDLRAMERLLASGEGCPYDIVCYHAEQAAERYLKALLTALGVAAPLVHDVEFYHNALPPDRRTALPASDLNYLSTYGIDPWWDPDAPQARRAIEIVRELRRGVQLRLAEAGA